MPITIGTIIPTPLLTPIERPAATKLTNNSWKIDKDAPVILAINMVDRTTTSTVGATLNTVPKLTAKLLALLSDRKIEAEIFGIVKDERISLVKAISKGLDYDILLISGGVSMGDYDMVPDVLKQLKVKKIFHKVRMKPGKPTFFGERKKKIVLGLPGNPLSTFVNYHVFVKLVIKKMMGYKKCKPVFDEGILKENYYNKEKIRECFVPVNIVQKENKNMLTPLKIYGSADVLSLSKAKGFMLTSPQQDLLSKGTKIRFIRI